MKTIPALILLSIAPLLASAQDYSQAEKDSLWKVIPALEGQAKLDAQYELSLIYFFESDNPQTLDTLLTLYKEQIEEAQRQNDIKMEGMAKGSEIAALANSFRYEEVIRRAPEYLDFFIDNELWNYYYPTYTAYLDAFLSNGQAERGIREAQKLYLRAKEEHDDDRMAIALFTIAIAYGDQQRIEQKEKYLRQSIDLLKDKQHIYPHYHSIYVNLCQALLAQKRYPEVLPWAETAEAVLQRYEASINRPMPTAQAIQLEIYADLYIATGQYDRAEAYCNAIDSLIAIPRLDWNDSHRRAKILESRKQFDQAMAIIDTALLLKPGNVLEVADMMWKKARILAQTGRTEEALAWFENAAELRDSVHLTDFNSHLDELHALYEVDKITAEKESVQNYLLFALGGCLLLGVLLGIWIYYSRLVMRKNRTMVAQIRELQEEQKRHTDEILHKTTFEPDNTIDENPCTENRKDELCMAIRDLLLKEKAYRDSTLTRDALVSRLGTNKALFADAFTSCFGVSFPEYINRLRLKDAISLLEQSALPIEEISEKAGFGTVRTFRRQFQTQYNMSPKEYRHLAKNAPDNE